MNSSPDSKRSAATALAAFLFLAALAFVAVRLVQPPAAVPLDAPPAEFSSARAMRQLRVFARTPHPTGSGEIEHVRQYVVGELAALGVRAEIQEATVVPTQARTGWPAPAARVRNIVARVAGTSNSRALMLAAHYDSVPTGPGASDDGAGVVTLLETLRALKSGPPLKNDLILVFSDAEELGLMGARAFADAHPLMKDVGLVLNFEARGAGGPSLMFETSDGNGALIREMAEAAPHPVANSLMYAVYKRLPNDTDMTVYKRAGAAGLNFAYADRITSYHTMLDSVDVMDERSLQHHGSYAVSLARHFGETDLANLRARDAVYFNALGPVFVHYSEALVWPLTVVACVLFAAVVFYGFKRRRLTLGGMGAGAINLVVASALAGLAAAGAWRVARGTHAGYAFLPWRTPYDVWPYALGFVFLAVAAYALVCALLFRKVSAASLLAGALAWWAVLLVLTTALLPLGSFLFAWPMLFAVVGLAVMCARGEGGELTAGGLVTTTVFALPCVALFAPLVYMFFMMLGLDLGGFFVVMVVLPASLLAPHFRALTFRRRLLLPALALLAGVGCVCFGLARVGFGPVQRRTNSVFYFLDADAGRASWVSTDATLDAWTSQFFGAGARQENLSSVFPWTRQSVWQADAPAASLSPPGVEVVEDRTEGDARTLRLRLRSTRFAPMLIFYADAGVNVRRASLDGKPLFSADANTQGEANAPLRVSFVAPPPEGLELTVETDAAAPFRLGVEDLSYGLPETQGVAVRPRADDSMPVPSYRTSDTTVVRTVFGLQPSR
ncbi:MAG TPA: M20/M25/M40 family metallo-hydrolase [Pyrinomonadaceae bacterium]|nr:M20/M25/M40 family metallo-hydrolase [Pyrinomonadaceae bacterium]